MKKLMWDGMVYISNKLSAINRIALIILFLMILYNYLGQEVRLLHKRFCVFKAEFMAFTRAYAHEMLDLEDEEDDEEEEEEEVEHEEELDGIFQDSSDEMMEVKAHSAASYSSDEWDFGSSDDTIDSEDEEYSMPDSSEDFLMSMVECRRRKEEAARLREQARIAEAIEFDEYLLSKGLIEESDFGRVLMYDF